MRISAIVRKVVVCVIFLCVVAYAEKVELGGPRSITAEVKRHGNDWDVSLRMRSVQSFDQVANNKVQRKLGIMYAMKSVGKLLGEENLSAASTRCEAMSPDGDFVTMRIKIGGLRVEKRKAVSAESVKKADKGKSVQDSDSLFLVVEDWKRVIESFRLVAEDGKFQVFEHSPINEENAQALEKWGDECAKSFKQLKTQIGRDIRLFQMERAPLLKLCDETFAELLKTKDALEKMLAAADKFGNVQLEAAYAPFILSSPSNMEEGVKVLTTEDGRHLLISVGMTDIRGEAPRERIRQLKAAELHAKKELIVWKESKVSSKTVMTEKVTEVRTSGSQAQAREESSFEQVVKERAEGVMKGLPKIGTWTSKDGTIFYLAIGTFL